MAWLVAEGDDNDAGMDRFMSAMFVHSDSDDDCMGQQMLLTATDKDNALDPELDTSQVGGCMQSHASWHHRQLNALWFLFPLFRTVPP